MRKAMVLAVSMAFLALMAGAAAAGDYHSGAQLFCSDCHTMHASQQHSFTGTALTTTSWTPTAHLLKGADVCTGCHDGSAAGPDVIAANFGSYVRQAGALSTTTSPSPYQDYKGHTIGATTAPPGGGTGITAGLQCVNCHDMHGSPGTGATDVAGNPVTSAYRNVKLNPAGTGNRSISYAIGTNDTTKDVFETSAALGTYSTHYSYTNVNFNRPSASASGFSEWCSTCHPNFHGTGNTGAGPTGFIRHPVEGITIGATTGAHTTQAQFFGGALAPVKTNWVKVMSPTGAWAPGSLGAVDGQPFCLSCHKAHGNQNSFGLIYMANTGTITEEGTAAGTYQDLCRQCHTQ